MTNIFAKYHLGLSQGKEIIDWANDHYIHGSDFDENFLHELAFRDKTDKWERAKAEDVFFDYFKMNDQDILIAIKRYFLELLERIYHRKCNLYELVDIVSRIKDKYQRPVWINELDGFCVYLLPDSTLMAESKLEMEIIQTIDDLKAEFGKTD